jgi:hypothetical protein
MYFTQYILINIGITGEHAVLEIAICCALLWTRYSIKSFLPT